MFLWYLLYCCACFFFVVFCVFFVLLCFFFFFSSRRRHTRCLSDWSSDVCSSDLSCAGSSAPEETMQPNDDPVGELKTNGPSPSAVPAEMPDSRVNGGASPELLDLLNALQSMRVGDRSEERRVGKEGRARWRRDRS